VIPLTKELQGRVDLYQVMVTAKDGTRKTVKCYAHTSNGACHIMLDEKAFEEFSRKDSAQIRLGILRDYLPHDRQV